MNYSRTRRISPRTPPASASRRNTNSESNTTPFLIPDSRPPRSVCYLRQILSVLKDNERRGRITTMRWPGGVERTGLVVGCWLVESARLRTARQRKGWKPFSQSSETDGQCDFVRNFERLQGSLVVPT